MKDASKPHIIDIEAIMRTPKVQKAMQLATEHVIRDLEELERGRMHSDIWLQLRELGLEPS